MQDKPKTTIKNWEEVPDKLQQLAENEAKLNEATALMNKKVLEAQAEFKDTLEGLTKDIEETRTDLLNFAKLHESDFETQKTRKYDYGEISMREGTGSLVPLEGKTEDKIIFNIKNMFKKLASTYITTKESLNKAALKSLDVKKLKKLGMEMKKTKNISIAVYLKESKNANSAQAA